MTEQEIVDYLKYNRNKGVAFGFMPREVRQYITSNFKNLLFLNGENQWVKTLERQECWSNMIFALPEDFELPPEPQGGWEEYEIKDGRFYEETHGLFYAWHEWSKCMSDNPRFTAFGGWQYPNCEAWYMNPKILLSDAIDTHYADVLFQGESAECMPAIPCKIRFWKG